MVGLRGSCVMADQSMTDGITVGADRGVLRVRSFKKAANWAPE